MNVKSNGFCWPNAYNIIIMKIKYGLNAMVKKWYGNGMV